MGECARLRVMYDVAFLMRDWVAMHELMDLMKELY